MTGRQQRDGIPAGRSPRQQIGDKRPDDPAVAGPERLVHPDVMTVAAAVAPAFKDGGVGAALEFALPALLDHQGAVQRVNTVVEVEIRGGGGIDGT